MTATFCLLALNSEILGTSHLLDCWFLTLYGNRLYFGTDVKSTQARSLLFLKVPFLGSCTDAWKQVTFKKSSSVRFCIHIKRRQVGNLRSRGSMWLTWDCRVSHHAVEVGLRVPDTWCQHGILDDIPFGDRAPHNPPFRFSLNFDQFCFLLMVIEHVFIL